MQIKILRASLAGMALCFVSITLFGAEPFNTIGDNLLAQPGLVTMEFIYEKAPFPSCHASTIAETKSGLIAAWFGGTGEKHPDVGIWVARHEGGKWTAPVEAANGVQNPTERFACWNPVLFQPKSGPLLLYYKVGPSPRDWWGMVKTSSDGGKTWSDARRLPDGILGPIKNKPIQLANGDLLSPSSTEHEGWHVHFERSTDLGKTWQKTGPIKGEFGVIQPSILTYTDGRLQSLCRSQQHKIIESWSSDNGKTWSELAATALSNPGSGIDAVTLANGRQLLVYNATTSGRSPLNVAVSEDGKNWKAALVLENQPGEYSYPAVIQTADGLVHITYTWKRIKVKHVIVDPAKLALREMVNGEWPQ